jgi:coproporphyrinogen III oxidase
MSLPSEVRWSYAYQIDENSEEAVLGRDFLPTKDWLE